MGSHTQSIMGKGFTQSGHGLGFHAYRLGLHHYSGHELSVLTQSGHGLGIHTKWSWAKGSYTQIGNELQSGHELWVHTQSGHGLGIHTKWSWAKGSYTQSGHGLGGHS